MTEKNDKDACCERGGRRQGCGRKPGIKTQPIRLPNWLLEQLTVKGDAKQLIIDACVKHYQLQSNENSSSND